LPFDSEKQVVIMFVQVDDAKPVNFVVARFLEDKDVDDGLPSLIYVLVSNGLVHQLNLPRDKIRALGFEMLAFRRFGVKVMWGNQGFAVCQVKTRGRSGR
jgi:hypothetical protein